MGKKPLKPCRNQCGQYTRETYCTACCERVGGRDGKRASSAKRGYDRRWRKLRALKLREEPLCQQCLGVGRTEPATVVHHLDPVYPDGEILCDLDRLESLCLSCHSKGEGWGAAMSRQRVGQQIEEGTVSVNRYVVCGPPASGKTTWVEGMRKPGDLVWDFDAVATVLTGISGHDRPAEAIGILMAMSSGMIQWLIEETTRHCNVYMIVVDREDARAMASAIGAEVITMDTDEATCLARIDADDGRRAVAARQREAVRQWFRSS